MDCERIDNLTPGTQFRFLYSPYRDHVFTLVNVPEKSIYATVRNEHGRESAVYVWSLVLPVKGE